ncbi:CoA transferase [Phenylobacterium sp.]|uniref:CoA transferase n=1 Tax=Phenylobacterium sp. TaxID=1871053 RepID=UPI00301E2661
MRDVRVLEISSPPTMLAGRILGDLGADVVAIEPPRGAPGRRIEPFADGEPGLERSLTWQALNYNKRGMTLDTASADGRALLSDLLERFDIVIEATSPSEPSPLEEISLRPELIRVQVRPFSPHGPKAAYRTTDLILMAAGGAPALAGESDRPPLFFPIPQAMMEAGAEAAVATLSALIARERDGEGQIVDTPARIAAMAGAMGRIVSGFSGDTMSRRMPPASENTSPLATSNIPCADGYVVLSLAFAGAFAAMSANLIGWVRDEGELTPDIAATDWSRYARGAEGSPPPEPLQELGAALRRLCGRLTKFEIVEASRKHGFMAAPVMTMKDIDLFPHYRERGLFVASTAGPDGRPIEVPARFVQLEDDEIEIRSPAPRLSQHTTEVLAQELGLTKTEIQALYVHEVI